MLWLRILCSIALPRALLLLLCACCDFVDTPSRLTAVFLFTATFLLAAVAVVVLTFGLDFNSDGSKFLLPEA